ncbi:proton-coupled zinc antiporter SLC30A2-like [Bolinopsis microptera]|uniref:proton-coupled zinc antiporter SLC30A2-like n=1 Tax=Bolinopsis microptera TaxID=2820187 RepID=UPI0030791EBB
MDSSPLLPNVAVQARNGYGGVNLSTPSKRKDQSNGVVSLSNSSSFSDQTCSTYTELPPPTNKARNKLIIASVICLLFTITEALGGYFSNSLAIFTDAAHMLIDFISYSISLIAIWIAKRPQTKTMTFGWYRAEVIGAVMSVFTIWVVTGVLFYLAIFRIVDQDYEIDANPMLITACLAVLVNTVMGVVLFPEDLWKSSDNFGQKEKVNINVRAAFIHVLGDLIQSVGVVVAAVIIKFKPNWKLADPICTFFFATLVLITTINILKDALRVLMEGMPEEVKNKELEQELLSISEVREVHSMNVWSLTMDRNVISVHLSVEESSKSYAQLLETARTVIMAHADFHQITVQLEPLSSSSAIRSV